MPLTTFISPPPVGAPHTGETTKRRLLNHHVLARLEDSLTLFVMLKPLSTRAASTKQANNVKGGREQCSGGDSPKMLRANAESLPRDRCAARPRAAPRTRISWGDDLRRGRATNATVPTPAAARSPDSKNLCHLDA